MASSAGGWVFMSGLTTAGLRVEYEYYAFGGGGGGECYVFLQEGLRLVHF